MSRAFLVAPWLAVGLSAAGPLPGPTEDVGFRFDAASTIEYGRYTASGEVSQGPYRSLGGQGFGQFDLNATWLPGPWQSLRLQFRGVVNGSDYRSPFDGIVIERISLRWNDGAGTLPWMVEGGDTFGYFSYRTLFRPLKGLLLELQPSLGSERRLSSLQLLVGASGRSWRDFDPEDDLFAGASYLIEDRALGSFSLSYVHNRRLRVRPGVDDDSAEQDVFTIAADRTVHLGSESLRLEGEAGRLTGEPARYSPLSPAAAEGGNTGLFLQLTGRGRSPLSYRLRYESYGAEFQPAGGSIYADRRSGEAHVAWDLARGGEFRGRYQRYRDYRESANPADTTVYGVGFSGRPLGGARGGIATSLDLFLQDFDSRDRALDARQWTLRADAYRSGGDGLTPRLGLFFQRRDDHTVRDYDFKVLQIQVGAEHPFRWGRLRGTLSPAILIRKNRDSGAASNDVQPTLTLPLYGGRHSLYQSLGYLNQDRLAEGALDVKTLVYRLVYRYTLERDSLSLEIDTQDRLPRGARRTTSLRAQAGWTHRFDGSTSRLARMPSNVHPESTLSHGFELAELRLGADVAAARERLARAGFGSGSQIGLLTVYETPLLRGIELRQRLVLVESDGLLDRAVLVIDPGAPLDTRSLERAYTRVREALIERYGRPGGLHEQGDFDPDLAVELAHGDFTRIIEWDHDVGILRFGIPRRLDGQIRMELQIAAALPPPGDPLWSVDQAQ